MNDKFDELAKRIAQSLTRRQALSRLGFGLAGMALACFGLANQARAATCLPSGYPCQGGNDCCSGKCQPEGSGDSSQHKGPKIGKFCA
jgi:hypothetical protein